MRRLIQWIYITFLGLYVRSHQQHIEDLEQMLSDLLDAQQTIDAEMAEVTRRLLDAHEQRDRALCTKNEWLRERKPMIDTEFPDPAPRAY